jgi:hypothetical protein
MCSPDRRRCYRASCRSTFGEARTVELVDQLALFFCHGSVLPVDDVTLGMLDVAP